LTSWVHYSCQWARTSKKSASSVNKIITPELGKNISQTIEHLAKLSAELDSLVQENKASLHQTLAGSAAPLIILIFI